MKINQTNNYNYSFKQNGSENKDDKYVHYYRNTSVILTKDEESRYKNALKKGGKNLGIGALAGSLLLTAASYMKLHSKSKRPAFYILTAGIGAVSGFFGGAIYSVFDKKCADTYLPKQKLMLERGIARQKQANM